jgi:hypothetical protein
MDQEGIEYAGVLPSIEVYRDSWQLGRYQAALSVRLPYTLEDADMILDPLGFEMCDIDQGGRSYLDRTHPRGGARVDETTESTDAVDLTLYFGGLEAGEIKGAVDRLIQYCRQIYYAEPVGFENPLSPAGGHRSNAEYDC